MVVYRWHPFCSRCSTRGDIRVVNGHGSCAGGRVSPAVETRLWCFFSPAGARSVLVRIVRTMRPRDVDGGSLRAGCPRIQMVQTVFPSVWVIWGDAKIWEVEIYRAVPSEAATHRTKSRQPTLAAWIYVAFQKRHASSRSSQNSIIIFGRTTPGKCHWHFSQKSGTLSHHAYRRTRHRLPVGLPRAQTQGRCARISASKCVHSAQAPIDTRWATDRAPACCGKPPRGHAPCHFPAELSPTRRRRVGSPRKLKHHRHCLRHLAETCFFLPKL